MKLPSGRARFVLMRFPIFAVASMIFATAASAAEPEAPSIERLDPALDELIEPGTTVRDLGGKFRWAEGPVWQPKTGELLFSDVPENVIHVWNPEHGYREYMRPSGTAVAAPDSRSAGSNGLAFDKDGHLLICEHGDRRITRFVAGQGKQVVANRWDGKRFNSPNDLVVHSSGAIYFTDPIYGLKDENDPTREIDFCGIFRVVPEGRVDLLARDLERPNGIGLSPDEKTLYVANSHRPRPIIMAYPLDEKGLAGEGRVFFDASSLEGKGSQDGLKVDAKGNVWATGPGGLLIINPEGKLLGRVLAGRSAANIGFGGADGKDVFLTATDRLLVFRRK
ncbi:MAG: SMP-30/gluconolactonase/LRE family protein [Verrucomicrobiales bacterium]